MDSRLIDEFESLKNNQHTNIVRIVSGVVSLLILVLSAFCYQEIIRGLNFYFALRNIYLTDFDVHGMISSFFLSSIPVITYNSWLKSGRNSTLTSYFILLIATLALYVLLFILGTELVFSLSHKANENNPLFPSYVLFPPVSFAFDLLFITSSLFSFLILKAYFYRNKSKKSVD